MRILLCTGVYPPDIGGPATYSKLLKDELPKHGFEVDVLSFGEVRKFPKIIRHIFYLFKVLKRGFGADIIYAQDPVSVGLPSLLVAKIMGKKFIIRVAGDYAWEQATQRFSVTDNIDIFQNKKYDIKIEFLKAIQKFVVKKADLIITPSNYFKKIVMGWDPKIINIHVIYNGMEPISINKINNKENLILSVGRLIFLKGFECLIDTMQYLPDWKLIIVGDGPERHNLEAKINDLDLNDRVVLIGGVSREKVFDYLGRAKIFILNSLGESFSFQIIEAMSAGIPIIASNAGAIPEILGGPENGILVEPNNKKQIISAIKKISEDKLFSEQLIEAAKIRAKDFSLKNTLEELIKSLNEL